MVHFNDVRRIIGHHVPSVSSDQYDIPEYVRQARTTHIHKNYCTIHKCHTWRGVCWTCAHETDVLEEQLEADLHRDHPEIVHARLAFLTYIRCKHCNNSIIDFYQKYWEQKHAQYRAISEGIHTVIVEIAL